MSAPVLRSSDLPPRVRGYCDALEWLLVSFGHRHVGLARASSLPAGHAIIWSNRPMPETALVPSAPEADLRCSIDPMTNVPIYLLGGSHEWSERAKVVIRLGIEIAVLGWAIQRIDEDGVLLARLP